jgi:hypothetical protein
VKEKSCQETGVILTGLKGEGEKLSRNRSYFDRFGGGRRKAVKK